MAILLSLEPEPWHLRHSRAVAETAAWLALRASRAGRSVDRRLVEAAALLHDVDKIELLKTGLVGLAHGDGSAEWLSRQGYPELGPAIVGHPVTRMADEGWFRGWLAGASPEALIVSYADKRAGQRLEPMAERFASWERRYPPAERAGHARGEWTAETVRAVRSRAVELERRVCRLAGVAPGDVRRLGWTGRAMAEVRADPGAGIRSAQTGPAMQGLAATRGVTAKPTPAAPRTPIGRRRPPAEEHG
jgi:HD domain